MIDALANILNRLVNQKDNLHVRFHDPDISEPALAFKVPFPRLEIVLEGELKENGLPLSETMLSASQVLYVQAGKWTLPEWTAPASTLSILFGRQKLRFCVQHWDGRQLRTEKQNVARLGPRVGSYLLLSLNEICLQPDPVTARLVVAALLSHCLEQLVGLEMRVSRSRDLFLAVQEYLEEHLSQPLTRESVAKRFHITPNYLSHIFQKSGSVGLKEDAEEQAAMPLSDTLGVVRSALCGDPRFADPCGAALYGSKACADFANEATRIHVQRLAQQLERQLDQRPASS